VRDGRGWVAGRAATAFAHAAGVSRRMSFMDCRHVNRGTDVSVLRGIWA